MRNFLRLFSTFSLLLLVSCSSISVKSDFDRGADFSKLQTYRWYDGKPIPGDALAKNDLAKKRIVNSVNRVLKSKGFSESKATEVDFIITIHAGSKEKMQVTNWGGYGWYDPWWGPYGGRVDVSYYEEGSLVVDIVRKEDKELIWRGVATGVVRDYSDPEDAQAFVDDVVTKVLAEFPPNAN